MNDRIRSQLDVLRLVTWTILFMGGALMTVVVSLAWIHGFERADGIAGQLAQRIVATAGYAPPFLLGAGLCVIGAMLFVVETRLSVGRHLGGIAGAALGMAVLLGAVTEDGGGAIGAATGGAASSVGVWLGVPLGIAALALPLWYAWLRAWFPGAEPMAAAADRGRALVEWMSRPPIRIRQEKEHSSDPRVDDSTEAVASGLSPAEADALVTGTPQGGYGTRSWVRKEPTPLPEPVPSSPYADDPRRRGAIPEGAKPLTAPDAEESPSHPLPPGADLRGRPEGRAAAGVASGANLAAPVDPRGASPAPAAGPAAAPLGAPSEVPPTSAGATAAVPLHPPGVRPLVAPTESGARPPAPSWEQEELFREQTAGAPVEPRPAGEPQTGASIPAPGELEREDLELSDEPADELDPSEEGEDEELEGLDISDDEEEEESEAGREVGSASDDDETDADADADADEDADDEDDEDETEVEEDDEEEESSAYQEQGEDAEDQEDEEEDEDQPVGGEELADDLTARQAVSPTSDEPTLDDVSEALEPTPTLEPENTEDPSSLKTELKPQPPPASSAGPAPRAHASREDLVFQAGLLFLERGRVAVSMLQRSFNLEFEDACKVLDELQERGLIGPYVVGQQREILMTQDEWLEQVPST